MANCTKILKSLRNFVHGVLAQRLMWVFLWGHTKGSPDYVLVGCTSNPLGWTVRGDDPFIVGFHPVNGSSIMEGGPFVATDFSTAKPAGLLVAGIAVTVLAVGGLLAGAFSAVGQGGRRQRRPRLRDWGVAGLMAVCIVSLSRVGGLGLTDV
jgi:hypothetical protein